MKLKLPLLILLAISLLKSSSLYAQDYAASLKVSTLGVNLEAIRSITPQFNARLGFAFLSYNANNVSSSSDYSMNGDLKFFSISALADWFPFENSFRLTGGIVVNLNKVSVTLTPVKTYTDGNVQYTPDKLGQLMADIDFNKVAPYLGIGFGNPTSGASGLGFTFDLGTFYQGGPKVTMSATKLLEPSASQGPILQDNLKWFKFYPVLSFGLTYKF